MHKRVLLLGLVLIFVVSGTTSVAASEPVEVPIFPYTMYEQYVLEPSTLPL